MATKINTSGVKNTTKYKDPYTDPSVAGRVPTSIVGTSSGFGSGVSSGGSSSGGGYYSSGGGSYVEEPSFDYGAYMAQMMAQQQAALDAYKAEQTSAFDTYSQNQLALYDQAYQDQLNAAQGSYDLNSADLRKSTDSANSQIDKNSAASLDAARLTTEEALRQANILKQQTERSLPAASLMTGGGGMSESALMDVYNNYNQSRDQTNTTYANTQKEIANQADNLKASNEQSYVQNLANLRDQLAQQQATYANNKTQAQMALEQQKAQFELELAQMIAQNNLNMVPQYAYGM